MGHQAQFPDSELAWIPQDPKVLESLVGDQCPSSSTLQRGEKRPLNQSHDEAFAPLARVLRTDHLKRPVLVKPHDGSEMKSTDDGFIKIGEIEEF